MVYLFSLGSAFFYGLAAVMQHREAVAAPSAAHLRIGLLVHLIRRPLWTAGIAADVSGFVLQAIALGQGPLTLVQPLLTGGLFFALIISALWDRRALRAREWGGSFALMVGLSLLLAVGSPTAGNATVASHSWVIAALLCGAGIVVLVLASRRASQVVRPALLAMAAAIAFSASDALVKSAVDVLQAHGVWEVLDGWYLYGLIGIGVVGAVLVQSAFQSGPLTSSLPALSAVEPVASTIVGIILFAETFATSPGAIAAEVIAAALVLLAVWLLGTSPVVTGAYATQPQPDLEPQADPQPQPQPGPE
ncbi:MAG: DMT family transporter [Actinomycetota bacterium]